MLGSPYEGLFEKLILFTRELSPCAGSCMVGTVVLLVAYTVFSIAPQAEGSLTVFMVQVTQALSIIFLVLFVLFHMLSGFKPTFCMNKDAERLNSQLEIKEKRGA